MLLYIIRCGTVYWFGPGGEWIHIICTVLFNDPCVLAVTYFLQAS